MNLYSGSLALSNAWDVLSPRKVGRQWWMVALLVVGVLCYPVNILQYTDKFLAVTGIMTNTWIFILLADYFVCRRLLGLAPRDNIEFREGRVRNWNPCGIIAMAAGVAVGGLGVFGLYPSYYASFIAMLLGPLLYVPLTMATRGQFYEPPKSNDPLIAERIVAS
jgi:cytosine permease